MYTNRDSNGNYQSFDFVAPDGVSTEKNLAMFPWNEKQTPAFASTLAVAVKQYETFLQPGKLTGNTTINLTIDAQVKPGAKLYLKATADTSNRTVTYGTGFDDAIANDTVTANSSLQRGFVYDGNAFVGI